MKHFISRMALLSFLFISFAYSADAQNNGRPQIDQEPIKVCWDFNGIDSSLIRYDHFRQGRTGTELYKSDYYNLSGALVDVTVGGTLSGGFCQADIEAQTAALAVKLVPMCDCDIVTDTCAPYLRQFLTLTDLDGNTSTTSVVGDIDYQGNSYTVQNQEGTGVCAVEEDVDFIDKEFLEICMIDKQSDGSKIDFQRIFYMHDSTAVDMDMNNQPYTITGTALRCADDETVTTIQLCDIQKRDVQFKVGFQKGVGNRLILTQNSTVSEYLGVTNFTIDCGQGELYTNRQFASCECDYTNSPDGNYQITSVLDFTNDGTAVQILELVEVRDGNITRVNGGNDINIPWEQSTVNYIDINFTNQTFLRHIKQDKTYFDTDLQMADYTPTGTVDPDCFSSNKFQYDQHYEPSTRPSNPIVASNECWERTISGTGNNWLIEDATRIDAFSIDGTAVPLNFNYGTADYQETEFIRDLQAYLIANNIEFASISVDNGDIAIKGLAASINSVVATGFVGATTVSAYTGDTTLLYSPWVYANNGNEAYSRGHEGEETLLPSDASRVRCSAKDEVAEVCQYQGRWTRTLYDAGQVINIASDTYHSVSIQPVTDGVFVQVGTGANDQIGIYSIVGAISADPCKYKQEDVQIDLSQVAGASVFVDVYY